MRKNRTISKILKLKQNKKKEIEIEVKKANDRSDEEETRLNSLKNDYRENLESLNDATNMEARNIDSFYKFFTRLNERIDQQADVCSEKQNELKAVKDSLIHAHKDEKMFEIMNDKALEEEKKEREKSEQNEADFFAISRKLR
jgi:flagellar export protein FliJ